MKTQFAAALAAFVLTLAGGAQAQSLDLSRVPPSINAAVPPNMMVTLDDSGSMAFGWTPDEIEVDDVPRQTNNNARPTICFYRMARFYSSDYNTQYYNPNTVYSPPLNANGDPQANATFTGAWLNGYNTGAGTVNLSTNYFVTFWQGLGNSRDNINYANNIGQTGTGINRLGTHTQCTGTNAVDVRNIQSKTAYFPIAAAAGFYCRWTGAANPTPDQMLDNAQFNCVDMRTESAAQRQNFANWFSYYRMRGHTAKAAVSRAFGRIDRTTRVAWQNLNANQIGTGTTIGPLTDNTRRGNFYTWLYNSPYSGGTPLRASTIRAGQFFERAGGAVATNPYYDAGYGRELSCRQNFHLLVTDGYWNESNPTAAAMANYDTTAIPSLPDGRAFSTSASQSRVIWNEQAPSGGCSGGTGGSNCSPTMADIAFYFWARDLRTNLDNNVPAYIRDLRTGVTAGAGGSLATPLDVPEIYWNPANNAATWQHMVNFIVGFGVTGTLDYDNQPATARPTQAERLRRLRVGTDQWPRVQNLAATTIDDAWHAAVNSRGQYLSAQNPQELVDAISAILDNISRRQGVTGSAGSTAFLRTDTVRFDASYDSGSWTGDINAFQIDPTTGQPTGTSPWVSGSAAEQLDARSSDSRTILVNTAGSGAAVAREFNWANLTALQRDQLNRDPITGAIDNLGEQRAGWIRGDRSNEQSNGGDLRNRASVLGPFIGSALINVTAPRFSYRGTANFPEGGLQYARYRDDNRDRQPTLYVGGNDGMLHAFNSLTGEEEWAFVPGRVAYNLARLTIPGYQFVPFVNNTPIDHDVLIGGEWRTVLIGTLGLGGQGVYAIDVTDPADPRVMWEFTDEGDNRLGYTYGRPNVVRLSDGTWVAMVSAGYNSEANFDYATRGLPNQRADGFFNAGGDSAGAVFAIRVDNGAVRRLDVPTARGLATVQAADYELDFEVDFLVAGDLNGDLWRIDLKNRGWTNLGGADIRKIFQGPRVGTTPQRPITSAPTIFADPSTGKMTIVVGTGKYLENGDRETSIPRQAIYGIRECGRIDSTDANVQSCITRYPFTQSTMVEQTLTAGSSGYLNMTQTNVVGSTRDGWFVQLGNPDLVGGALRGERVIDMSLPVSFPSGIVAVGSFIPSNDPCTPLGTGVIYVLSAFTGGFALPGNLNSSGTAHTSGTDVIGGGDNSVGRLENRPPDMSAFIDPNGGAMSVMGRAIRGVPIRRRSGWRDLPMD